MIKVRIRWLIAVLSLVVVFGLSIWTVRVQSSSRALWEYRYISISETQTAQTEDILNKLGAEGWELVAHAPIMVNGGGPRPAGYYYFKRAK